MKTLCTVNGVHLTASVIVALWLCVASPALRASQSLTLSLDPQNVLKFARVIEGVPQPKSTSNVLPVYPPGLPAAFQGRVTIKLTVAKDGTVKDANVVTHAVMFDDAALVAVRQSRFEPVIINGAPVEVVLSRTLTFPKGRGPVTISDLPPAVEAPCPKLIEKVDPKPATGAIPLGARGRIIVELVIGTSGKVKGAQILSGFSPALDQVVLDAVRQWTYEQTKVNGLPMEAVMVVVINVSN